MVSVPLAAQCATEKDLSLIVDLKDAYEKKDIGTFERLSSQLSPNSLFLPNADAWEFRLRYGQFNEDEGSITWPSKAIKPVLEKHDNTWASELLRRDWLEQLAMAQEISRYKEERKKLRYRPDQGVECADMLIAAFGGQYVAQDLHNLVTKPRRLPQTCRILISYLHKRQVLSANELDIRVFNLTANKQLTNAGKFIEELGWSSWASRINEKAFRQAVFNPMSFVKGRVPSKSLSTISTAALTRIAVSDYKEAASLVLGKFAKSLKPEHEAWLWGYIGYQAALNWDTSALQYFDRSDLALLNTEQLEWRVRMAILHGYWAKLSSYIDDLPANTREEPRWQYWKSRALAKSGNFEEANLTLIKIANPFNFYGKLATEELGASVESPAKPAQITAQELREAKTNPGLLRSLAFYDAGLRTEGFREFNLQTEQMNDRQLLAAATWALNNQLYDRAIAAADRTEKLHDLELRYPTPFKINLVNKANEIGVEDAWVYGVIRQESRFVSIARSSVGANGLMQVMPATAKYVARKIGLKGFQLSQVNQIDTNLTLGTSYLKMVREGLDDHIVMASAGYNAGPSRPKTWRSRLRSDQVIEGAVFAELIPFDETREYVQNVLSNTMAYSLVLHGATVPLKNRLSYVSANPLK